MVVVRIAISLALCLPLCTSKHPLKTTHIPAAAVVDRMAKSSTAATTPLLELGMARAMKGGGGGERWGERWAAPCVWCVGVKDTEMWSDTSASLPFYPIAAGLVTTAVDTHVFNKRPRKTARSALKSPAQNKSIDTKQF